MSTWAAPCSGVVPSKSGLKKCVFVSNFGCAYIFKWAPTLHIELVCTVQVSFMSFLCLSFLYFHLQTSAPALTSLSATLKIIKVRFITNAASALVTVAHVQCAPPRPFQQNYLLFSRYQVSQMALSFDTTLRQFVFWASSMNDGIQHRVKFLPNLRAKFS